MASSSASFCNQRADRALFQVLPFVIMSSRTKSPGIRVPAAPVAPRRPTDRASESRDLLPSSSHDVLRFRKAEVLFHWAIAVPFLVCYSSALLLVVLYLHGSSTLDPTRQVISWVHRVAGLALLALPLLVAISGPQGWKTHFENLREGWVWSFQDVRWLLCMARSVLDKRVRLPDQGKFNAGEKLNFMMVTVACPLFIATGLLIWLPGIAFTAWLLHVSLAAVVTPFMLGHIFMATINPDTRPGLRGMFSGFVNRSWAKHHYRQWYVEKFESGPGAEAARDRTEKTAPRKR